MKNYALFFTAIGSVISYSCFAQSNVKTLSDMTSQNDLAVVSYHVEERINMNFGGSIRTYDVPNLDMITPKDLGQNNVRIVTPVYAKVKAVAVEAVREKITTVAMAKEETVKANATSIISKPIDTDVLTTAERKREYVNIDVIDTYERIMDKGYKSVAMIIKVADRHFFDGDLVLAAKWYNELFNNTKDLEAVYYYRYAESLKAVNQLDKAREMMKIFETKSL
jgi:GTPase SAR1 family protein